MDNEEWKEKAQPATLQDCRKYAYTKARLLAMGDRWSNMILEIYVLHVTENGTVCIQFVGGFCMNQMWLFPEDIKVVEILPLASQITPVSERENPPE